MQEELIRAKAQVHSLDGSKNGYSQVSNVRESLNQLRVSLNRYLFLPHVDNDTDDEVGTADVGNLHGRRDEVPKDSQSMSLREKELENVCNVQAAKIKELNQLVEQLKLEKEQKSSTVYGQASSKHTIHEEDLLKDEDKDHFIWHQQTRAVAKHLGSLFQASGFNSAEQ
ncbi:hypothetical protein RJT34_07833 [Clitoria ternatea]|uniref:Uncharacterized protein n=1 Tax=Clitoria ternatea TaxID=43366 RepID=A0AAN9K528_CLITE